MYSLMWVLVHPGPNFKLKSIPYWIKKLLIYINAGKSMKHAHHASYAHIIIHSKCHSHIRSSLCQNLAPVHYLSLSYGQRENPKKKVPPGCMKQTFWWYTNAKMWDITLRVCTSLLGVCLLPMQTCFWILRSSLLMLDWFQLLGTPYWSYCHAFFWKKIWHVQLVLGTYSKNFDTSLVQESGPRLIFCLA